MDLCATVLRLGQIDHLGLIDFDQSTLLPVEPLELGNPPQDRAPPVVLRLRHPGEFLESFRQSRRVFEQSLDVPPDGRVELAGLGRSLRAPAGPVAGHGVLAVALVVYPSYGPFNYPQLPLVRAVAPG